MLGHGTYVPLHNNILCLWYKDLSYIWLVNTQKSQFGYCPIRDEYMLYALYVVYTILNNASSTTEYIS